MAVAGSCRDEVFEVIESVLNHLGGFGKWYFEKLEAYRTSKAGKREDFAYADSFKDGVTYTSKENSNGVERDVSWTHSVPLSHGGISNLIFFGALPMLCVVYWLWFFIFGPDVPIWDIQDISFTCIWSLVFSAVLSGLGLFIGLLRIISPVRISVPDPNDLNNKIFVKSNPKVYKWLVKICVISLAGTLYLFNSCGFGDVLIKDFGDYNSGLAKGSSIRFYPRSAGDALVDAFQNTASESKNEDNKQNNSFNNEQTETYNFVYDGEEGKWKTDEVKITFGKKQINAITSHETATFIIVGNPEKESTYDGGFNIKYNVYDISNNNREMMSVIRSENQTKVIFDRNVSNGYVIFKKNKQQPKNNSYDEEQTEYYNYYYHGDFSLMDKDWEALKTEIIFSETAIKIKTSNKTLTYIIVGSPESKYDETKDIYYIKYNAYFSDDADHKIISIEKYKNETDVIYEEESENYEIFKK